MAKKKNAGGGAVSKNQTNATRTTSAGARKVHETVINAGTYDVPGGKLTINDKGITTYEGTPYMPVTLKWKYLANQSDRGPDGKVKIRMGKSG